MDAYFAEAGRLIDAPDLHRKPGVVVYVDPAIQQNFTRAYQQSVVANDRIHLLNYAKAVSCLRLITVVKVRGPAALCKSALLYIYMSVVHEYKLDVDAHNNNNYYNEFELLQCHIIRTYSSMLRLCRLHGRTIGGATKVGSMQAFVTTHRKSLKCSQLLDGHSTGKAKL